MMVLSIFSKRAQRMTKNRISCGTFHNIKIQISFDFESFLEQLKDLFKDIIHMFLTFLSTNLVLSSTRGLISTSLKRSHPIISNSHPTDDNSMGVSENCMRICWVQRCEFSFNQQLITLESFLDSYLEHMSLVCWYWFVESRNAFTLKAHIYMHLQTRTLAFWC